MTQIEDLGAKVDRLEISTRRLTAEVTNLGSALERVRRLEDEQVELREQTTLAMFNALAAADQATATHHEFAQAERAHSSRDRRRTHAVRMLLLGMLILLPLVSAFVYAALLARAQGLVDQQKIDLVNSCKVRNQSVEVTIKREEVLAKTDIPQNRAAHQESVDSYRKLIDDCEAKYGPKADL